MSYLDPNSFVNPFAGINMAATTKQSALVTALVEVSKEIGFLEFDKTNKGQGYGYASASGVIRRLNKELAARGILIHGSSSKVDVQIIDGKQFATVTATYIATNGTERLVFCGEGGASDKGDKAVMKASTAAFKYALAHLLMLAWDAEDPEDDGGEEKKPKKAKNGDAHPVANVKDLARKITDAGTLNQLELLKPEIGSLRQSHPKEYEKLKDAYVVKKNALQAQDIVTEALDKNKEKSK